MKQLATSPFRFGATRFVLTRSFAGGGTHPRRAGTKRCDFVPDLALFRPWYGKIAAPTKPACTAPARAAQIRRLSSGTFGHYFLWPRFRVRTIIAFPTVI